MSTIQLVDIDAIAQTGRITDRDVQDMRRAYFQDGTIDAGETMKIFKLGDTCQGESDAWPRFLVEALTDYIVYQTEPRGYVSESQAGWLIENVSRDGQIASHTELELLVKILEVATEVPDNLVAFTLNAIKSAILEGDGQLIGDGRLEPGIIGRHEVDLLRRVLYAAAGSQNITISRHEAELLFDLNDATVEHSNHPAWSDLFTKAILNHLMAANHYKPVSFERALRANKWLDEPDAGVTGFFGRMFSNEMLSIKGMYQAVQPMDWQADRAESMDAAAFQAEAVTSHEANWLAARIGRDGALHDNEKAILRFIRDECPELHPGLEDLLTKI